MTNKKERKQRTSDGATSEEKDTRVNAELRKIYEAQDGNMPDLSKMEQAKSSPVTRFLVGLIIVLTVVAAVAWTGFLFWSETLAPNQEPLITSIEGPQEVKAGEPVFYHIRYKNDGDVPFATMDIQLNVPDGFQIKKTIPAPTEGMTWQVGALSPGSDGELTVEGIFRSPVPSSQNLQAFITYRPANFSSDFQKVQSKTVDITNSVAQTTISGPEKAVPGDPVDYIIQVQNNGSEALTGLEVHTEIPEGFTTTSLDPAPMEPDIAIWTIDTLKVGEIKTFAVNGSYTSSVEGTQTVRARTVFVLDETLVQQSEHKTFTDILGGNFILHQIVDGSSDSQTAQLGETLNVSLDYENGGNELISGIDLALILEAADGKPLPIDWEAAALADGTRQGGTIRWSETERENLIALQPDDSGVIDLSLPLLSELDPKTVADRFTLKTRATMQKVGSVESERTIETNPIEVAINSDLRPVVGARYYDDAGDPIGAGPMPPTAGKTTTYQINWRIENSLHSLDSVVMSTNLPPNVVWKDDFDNDIGTISFDETTRLVTWRIERLPTDAQDVSAAFMVSITPDASDVGTFVKLTNATSVEAVDTATDGRISKALDILTTELAGDEHANGQGVVIE